MLSRVVDPDVALARLVPLENQGEAPARNKLTIEHVMPQSLTAHWKGALGDGAEEIHGRCRHGLANLTLSGDATNSSMAADPFDAKRKVYGNSAVGMTRRLANENEWNEDALERRADDLTRRVLHRWPWPEQRDGSTEHQDRSAALRWRIEDGPWRPENAASQMVLNVAGALLSRDPANAGRLSGEAISSNVFLASSYPPGTTVGTQTMRAIPGHDQYVLHPYALNYPESAERCRKMGKRCGVRIEVQFEEESRTQAFWRFLKAHVGGVPGQKESWRGATQWTGPFNSSGDLIGSYVGNDRLLWLYIRAGDTQHSAERAARMQRYSRMIREQMGDQELGGHPEKYSVDGWSVSVQRGWTRDDEAEWPEAAQWIKEQHASLQAILAGP